jgi:hypothetical protein
MHIYLNVSYDFQNKNSIFINRIYLLFFVIESQGVFCDVWNEFLNIVCMNFIIRNLFFGKLGFPPEIS